jgi:excinuclease UvrABC ATPase subunit
MAITAEQSREFLPGSGSRDELRILGANVHNLRKLNLALPLGKWISVCGVSGSGKTSLALDTIYASGQLIETKIIRRRSVAIPARTCDALSG